MSTQGVRHVYAATSSTLNFQGRLYTSSGSTVPDGYYNVQFKLYDGGTDGGPGGTGQANAGTNLWTESYYDSNGVTAGNDNRLRVVNGYFSTNLGSQTAFPGTINWDQELWLTMNVGGTTQTATPTYDGEMLQTGNTRTKLTGVPYAFRAGAVTDASGNAYTGDDLIQKAPGSVQSASSANSLIRVNQTGAGGLLQLQSGGSDAFTINNSGNVVSAGTGTFQGASLTVGTTSQSGSLVLYDGSSNTVTLSLAAQGQSSVITIPDPGGVSDTVCLQSLNNCAGTGDIHQNGNSFGADVTIGSNDTYALNLETNGTTVATFSSTGAALFRNSTDSTTAFQIQNAAGTNTLVKVDTTSNLVTNDGFETNTSGWSAYGGATLTRSTSQSFLGSASLQIATTAAANDGAKFPLSLSSNSVYTFSFAAKIASGSFSTLQFGSAQDGVTDSNCNNTSHTVTTSWTRYVCTITTGAVSGSPYVYIKQTDATSRTFFVDDVSLTTRSVTITGAANGIDVLAVEPPSQSATSTAFISVDGGRARFGYDGTSGSGNAVVQSATSKGINFRVNGLSTNVLDINNTGNATFRNNANSTTGFQIQTDVGTSLFTADTTNQTLSIGTTPSGTTAKLRIDTGSLTGLLVNVTGGGNSILDLQKSGTSVVSVANAGATIFKNQTDSTTAFQIQNAAGNNLFRVDTSVSNLLTNPSIEQSISGNWAAKGASTVSQDSTQKYIGSNSLKIITTAVADDGALQSYTFSNVSYNLSFYAKLDSGSAAFATLQAGYNRGSDTSCLTAQTVVATGWTRFNCTFTPSAGAGHIYIKQTDATAHTFYIDAIQLVASSVSNPYRDGNIALNGVVNSPSVFQNQSDSTTAFQIQNAAGTSNLLIIDTLNTKIGIGKVPTIGTLDVNGIVAASQYYTSNGIVLTNTGQSAISKQVTAGTTGFAQYDVVVFDSTATGTDKVITTTTARDNRVYGVATAAAVSGGSTYVATSGTYTINVDTGAVAAGDQLVTSTNAGKATVDNNATTGIIGIALSSKAGGSNGTVSVSIRPVGGQYSPVFRNASNSTSGFQIQDANGASVLNVETTATNHEVSVGSGSGFAGLAINGGTSQVRDLYYRTAGSDRFILRVDNTAESGSNAGSNFLIRSYDDSGAYLGTPLTIYRNDGSISLRNTTNSANGFNILQADGSTRLSVDTQDSQGLKIYGNSSDEIVEISNSAGLQVKTTGTTAWTNLGTDNASTNILNLYDNGNTSVGSVSGTGAVIFNNSTNSVSAFQIQNAAGSSLFTADTTNSKITTKDVNVGNPSSVGDWGRLFSDDFEGAVNDKWTGGTTTSGTSTALPSQTQKRNGKFSERINATGTGAAYLSTSITGATTTTFRGYIYIASQTNDYTLMELRNGSSAAELYLENTTGKIAAYNTANSTSYVSTNVPSTGAWHQVEMDVTYNATTGSITVYVDGTQVINQTNINTGTTLPNTFRLGESTAGRAADIYFDDVVVDTVRPGDSANLYVADSLHVAGTSTFGNSVLVQPATNVANGFVIQDTSRNNVLTADTLNNRVLIGTSATNVAGETLTVRTGNGYGFVHSNGTVSLGTYVDGSTGQLGTYSNNSLDFFTNNQGPAQRIYGDGTVRFKNYTDSSTSFQIQNAAGTTSLFNADTSALKVTIDGDAVITGSLALEAGADYSTTGTSNNVNFGSVSLVRLTGASAQTITGIANGTDGELLTIINAAGQTATISNQSASSTAANRIITGSGADIALVTDSSVSLVYDATSSRWRVVGAAATGTGGDTLQAAYNVSTGGTTPEIKLDSTRGGIDIQDADSTIGASLLTVRGSNGSGLGAALFDINSTGQTLFKNSTNSATAFQIQNSTSGVLFKADTTTNIVDVSSLNINGTTTNGLNLTNGTFSGLAVKDNAGDQLNVFNNWNPQRWDLAFGTAASPITTAGPSVKISRTENISAATCGGNAVDNECNAALVVESKGLTGSGMQPAAIFAGAQGSGAADVNGLQAVGRITGSGTGLAAGAYLEGRRDTNTATAVGTEIRVTNETATDGIYNTGGVSNTTGIWLTSNSSSGSDSGVGIGLASVSGSNSQWVVGLGFTNGSVKTTSISDDSSAVTSIDINGTHTYGVDLQGGTFSAGAIRLGNQQSITVRNNANTTDLNILTTNTTDQLLVGTGSSGVIVKPGSNNTTAFQVQNTGGTNVLQVDTQNSRVGVGITNPGYTLDVSSTDNVQLRLQGSTAEAGIILNPVAGSASKLLFQDGGTTKFEFGKSASNNFNLYDNANGRDVFQATASGTVLIQPVSGNVGIGAGATNPQALLHVAGAGGGSSLFRVTDTTATSRDVLDIADGGAVTFRNQTDSTGAFRVQNAAGSTLLNVDSSANTINLLTNNSGELQAWQTNANTLTTTMSDPDSVVANGFIYTLGGNGTTTNYAKLNNDGSTGAFATTTALPASIRRASAVSVNGYIYVIGGYDGASVVSTVYYAKVKTDGTLGSWTTSTNALPAARDYGGAFAYNGYIYFVAGSDNTNGVATVYSAKTYANGSTSSWTTLSSTPLPANRLGIGLAVANGYVYVAGGKTTEASTTGQTAVYYAKINLDGTLGSWTTSGNALALGRHNLRLGVANGYLYGFAGRATAADHDETQYAALAADGSVGAWTQQTNLLPAARSGHAVAFANGYFYVLGGGGTNTVYYASTPRVKIAGSLDLVGSYGQTLADAGGAGSLTAGNTKVLGSLEVQGQATFAQGLVVDKDLRVGGSAFFQNTADSTTAFIIQNSAGTSNLFVADTTNTRIGIGTSSPAYTLDVAGDINGQAIRDAIGWVQTAGGVEKLKNGINNGSFGGGSSINKQGLTSNDVSFFDSSTVNANSKSFASAIFDGRYIYFIPFYRATGATYHGQITRYDTTKDFSSTSSYTVFDTTAVNANSKGFLGASFDGRYIYLIPYATAAGTGSGQITRYDTQASFTSTSSYSVYDTTAVNANSKGFVGGVFDGRYLYLVPYYTGAAYSGQITRYDTTASFTAAGSYSVYDTTAVNANSKGFYGAVFDGKYIYFVPNVTAAGPTYSGQVTRYDTTGSFTSSGSYSVYDTTAVNASSKGFQGAVFDGRYIYYVPYATASTTASGLVTRYDTYGTFNSSSSYSVYDMGNVSATAKGFDGGFFDGKYVYFIPHYNVSGSPTFHGNVARYDTSQSFTSASSYTVLDTGAINASSKGFVGGAFDGRYLYMAPYSINGANNGQITRIKTYSGGVDTANSINKIATSSELLLNSNGSVSLQNNTDSTTAFSIQNSAGNSQFVVNTSTGAITIGSTAQTGAITVGQSTDDNTINIGAGVTATGKTQTINIGTGAATGTAKDLVTIGSTNGASAVTLQAGSGNINFNASAAQFSEVTGTRTINVQTRTTNVAGTNLTLVAGAAGTGASAFSGGTLTLQGGAAGGTGNANGGSVTVAGGAGVGTGTQGLVNLSTSAFTSASEQSFSSSTSITAGNVDLYSSLPVKAITNTGLVLTVPDPAQTAIGRLLYITARSGSLDFTLRLNSTRTAIDINMKANSTATLIWNGTDWTAAGASSSTDLQAAYNNTVSSAGGAELVLNASGGAADGLTVRNNGTTPIIGGLLEVQSSTGSNLFAVNNNATEYATNGGSETAGGTSTTFPSNTWSQSATGGTQATISRTVTSGEFATGVAAAKVVTTGATTANQGIANQIAVNGTNTALTANLTYTVAFTVKGTANFSTLDVVYSKDGTNTATTSCTTGKTVTQTVWTRIGCTFTAPSSGITTSNAIFIRQSDSNSTARTFYIDNLSLTVSANTNHAVDGSVDSALGTNWTTFGAGTAVTRDTTTLYDTSGSVKVDTTNNTDRGVTNNLTIAPSTSTQYLVTFYAKLGSGTFTDIRVRYSRDGGTNFVSCADYNTQTLSTSVWTKITCLFTTDSTTATNADLIIDQPTAPGSTRTFYVDALSVTLNTNNANNVQIGGGSKGGPVTLFTLDRSAGAPIAANNDAYLGSMYYDTTTGRIQCYESAGWGTCGAPPDNIVNLNPEYAGAVLNGTGVGTMTADLCSNDTALSVNTSLCSTGQAKNFYKWTSPQATQQTYSIYVSYQLPSTFNGFSSDDTVQLVARVDNTTNASVTYQMFKSTGSAVTQCGSGETDVITGGGGSANTWYSYGINGNEATGCSFTSSSAGNYLLFKINLKANSNANAYVSTLSFTTTGR